MVNIKDASFTLGNSPVRFSGARKASANSYINAENSAFIAKSGTVSMLEKDQWYGSFSFNNCALNGITFGADSIINISGAAFGAGTVFTNSDVTFNSEKTAFSSSKLSLGAGCSLYSSGNTVEVSEGEKDPDNLLKIGNTANHDQNVYTFSEAWDVAMGNPGNPYVFKLNEDINITRGIIKVLAKTDVTIDLNGYTFTAITSDHYLVSYQNNSTGSKLSLVSSREGGKLVADNLVVVASGSKTVIDVAYGSDDSYPISVETVHSTYGYLVYATGNFKNGSTLNLSVKNGTYDLCNGLIFVNNYGSNANDIYKVDISDSVVTIGNAGVVFSGSFRAVAASYINASNTVFNASEGNKGMLAANQFDGSLAFDNCTFNGIVFDETTLGSISGATFSKGCSFINSDASFNSDKNAFASDKVVIEDGCILMSKSDGSISVSEKPQLPDNVYLIANTANHDVKIYTWNEAWGIAVANPDNAYVFRFNEDYTISSGMVKLTSKTNVTIDLNGYTFTVLNDYHYLISYQNGSTGSSLSVMSSREGGKLVADNLVVVASGGKTVINLAYGSDDGYPITVDLTDSTYGYFAYATGNFKGGSTLNLSVKNGTYNLCNGFVFANNYGSNTNNTYKIDISNSNVTIGNAGVVFSGSFRAVAASYINASNTVFNASEGNKPMLAANQFDGSLSFDNCTFNGIVFDETTLDSISGATFGEGCRFINSDASFNAEKSGFVSNKLTVAEGYILLLQDDGSILIGVKPVSAINRISITIFESISINLYATITDEDAGARVRFTLGDRVVYVDGVMVEDGVWKFVFEGIGPQSMTEIVTAELVLGDDVIHVKENISVKNYCDLLFANGAEDLGLSAEKYEKLRVLMTNLLRYGSTAQIYKNNNVDDLADASIDESLLIEFVNPDKKYSLGEIKTPGIEITGANVWFDSVNRLRIRFTTTDVENTTIRVDGKEYGAEYFEKAGANTFIFTSEPVLPDEYNKDFTFELCFGGEVQHSLVYGISCYITSMQSSANESVKRMVQALYAYGVAATDYIS